MDKVAVSTEKLQQILLLLDKLNAGQTVDLQPQVKILIAAFESLLTLHMFLASSCSIKDIRKLFGVGAPVRDPKGDQDLENPGQHSDLEQQEASQAASGDKKAEPAADPSGQQGDSQEPKAEGKAKNMDHPGKSSVDDYPQARRCHHYHPGLRTGDPCPVCLKGKLYEERARSQLLFEGTAPISPVVHVCHDLRCNFCKSVFNAKASEQARADGLGREDRYGYSAIAMIAILKYFSQLPWYRSARLHDMTGVNLSASSQFDQCEKLANALDPIDKLSGQLAAVAGLYMVDDASAKILSCRQAIKNDRRSGKPTVRDGCHSSVVIAFDERGQAFIRIKTAIIHAGEWMDSILNGRPSYLPPPKVMWDRLSSNTATVRSIIDLACNQHARANFKDAQKDGPKLVDPILSLFKEMFRQDALTRCLDPSERLAHHQKHTQPIFAEILVQCHRLLDEKVVTPSSNIGGACQYMINHEPALSGFLKYEGAPISNNLVERTILYLVILRNNVHFFKNHLGARVADIILSTGLSAFYYGVNIFHYFRLILANSEEVKADPASWLPGKFLERYPEYTLDFPERVRRDWLPDPLAPYTPRRTPA